MHLYTGLRTSRAELLFRAPCVRREPIQILRPEFGAPLRPYDVRVVIADSELSNDEKDLLAWRDGFRSAESTLANSLDSFRLMVDFWVKNHPKLPHFSGHLYEWEFERRFK
jgi:hypothetical protein